MKTYFIYKFMITLTVYSQNTCVGLVKGHSTQHCMLFMLENLKQSLDYGVKSGILLTDLSKVFDSISHDLILVILNAYGFYRNSINLINNYLTGRKQRSKIGDNFSSWRDIVLVFYKVQY